MPDAKVDDCAAENLRGVISDVWKRARINAYAHRAAADRFEKWGVVFFSAQILAALLSVIFVIQVNLSESQDCRNLFTILSAVAAIAAIFFCVTSAYCKFDLRSQEHNFLLGSFQHIAQRAREAKWPDKPYDEMLELLRDMERDFQILKARGIEPRDKDFQHSHKVMKSVAEDPKISGTQSFPANATKDDIE